MTPPSEHQRKQSLVGCGFIVLIAVVIAFQRYQRNADIPLVPERRELLGGTLRMDLPQRWKLKPSSEPEIEMAYAPNKREARVLRVSQGAYAMDRTPTESDLRAFIEQCKRSMPYTNLTKIDSNRLVTDCESDYLENGHPYHQKFWLVVQARPTGIFHALFSYAMKQEDEKLPRTQEEIKFFDAAIPKTELVAR